jgi:hypothetical protein
MLKFAPVKPPASSLVTHVHDESWEKVLQAALSVLKDIDSRYSRDRARIESLTSKGGNKRRLLERLEIRHRKDREPYVLQVADIYQRMTFNSLFRTVH